MTRRMADSVTPANLPPGFDVYAGYDDGSYNNIAQIKAMYPDKPVLAFTVFATDLIGDYLDVETGDATADEAPGWVASMRAQGHPDPGVYCSLALWPAVQQAFVAQNVPEPPYIIAAYPGPGPVMIQGAIGHQWIDHGPYDESVVADYIPGVDPAPVPTIGEQMPVSPPIPFGGIQHVFQTSSDTLWWKRFINGTWVNKAITGPTEPVQSSVRLSIPDQWVFPVIIDTQLLVTVQDSTKGAVYFALDVANATSLTATWGVNELP